MARRVFAAGSVSNSTGAPLRLSFYTTQTRTLPESDLWTVDGSFYPSVPIPNGTVLTNSSGAYSSFAGPEDIDSLWIAPSNGAARTQITATRAVASAPSVDATVATLAAAVAADSSLTGAFAKLLTTDTTSTAASGTLAAWHLTPVDATSGSATWALPAASSVVAGVETAIKKADTSTNTVTVSRAGSDLIYGTGSGATSKTLTLAGEAITFVSNGVDRWTVQTSDTPSGVLASTYLTQATATSTYASVIALTGTGIDLTGATDSTTALNVLLATASGKTARGVPGSTYLISAPLVAPSGATLDMTGCTVTLAAASNCNMLNNAAVTAVRSVSDGAINSSGTTLTSATAAFTSADVGRSVTIAGATSGGYLLVTTISAVTDANTATVALAAGATVTGATVALYNRDANVTIVGGTWARGSNAGSGSNLHSFRFRHVDGLKVRDLKVTSSAGKYAISLGDVTKVRVRDIDFAVFSDGVHLAGPSSAVLISGLTGTSTDDAVSVTPQDWAAYADTLGDVSDLIVTDIEVTTAAAALNLLGGAAGTLKRVRARNIGGSSSNSGRGAVQIGNDSGEAGTTTGAVDDIRVDNITTRLTNTSNSLVKINAVSGGQIRLKGLTHASSNAISRVVTIPTGTSVTFLSVEDVSALNNTATDGIWVTGTVNDLVVKNWVSSITGYVLRLDDAVSGATVSRATLTDVHLALPSANGGFVRAQQSAHTLPVVQMANCSSDKSAWLGDVGCTVDFNLASVRMTNNGGILNARATAVVALRGAGNSIAKGSNGIAVTSGGKVANLAFDLPPSTAAGGFPTIAAGAGLGSSPTVVVAGADRAGTLTLTPGSGAAAGDQATVTFQGTWPQTPKIALTPTNAAAQTAGAYLSAKSTTAFTVATANTPGGAITFDYHVLA